MVRTGVLSDLNQICPLDSPIPLAFFKNLKPKEIPKFRPRTVRDYIKNKMKYSNTHSIENIAFDKTNFDVRAEINRWFKEAEFDDYVMAKVMKEYDSILGPNWESDFERDMHANDTVDAPYEPYEPYEPFIDLEAGMTPHPTPAFLDNSEEGSPPNAPPFMQGLNMPYVYATPLQQQPF